MPASVPADKAWRPRRRWLFIGLLFFAQLVLIFRLGETSAPEPRPPSRSPQIRFPLQRSSRVLALTDPTLFALPHREGFAGEAWLKAPPLPVRSFDWRDQPVWLTLPVPELGALFASFMNTNQFADSPALHTAQPELAKPLIASAPPLRQRSSVRLEGPLVARKVLTPFALRSWPHADTLTNTVVALMVDASGLPVSVNVLSSCGLKEADQYALLAAGAARFSSIESSGPRAHSGPLEGLTWGRVVFEWQTTPLPATNNVPPAPQK